MNSWKVQIQSLDYSFDTGNEWMLLAAAAAVVCTFYT